MVPRLSLSSLLLLSSSVLSAQAAVLPRGRVEGRSTLTLAPVSLKPFQKPSADVETSHYATLEKSASSTSRSFEFLRELQIAHNPKLSKRATPDAPLIPALGGSEYLTEVTVGSQTVKLIVDTGSSDTWLIQSSFQCVDANGTEQSQSTCNFGPLYDGTFGSSQIANVNFNIGYGDGETVTGTFGYEDVEIAGITVPKQEIALGDKAYWNGDGVSTGLVGLAYPAITSAFKGSDPSQDTSAARVQYNPLFTTMYKDNLSSPMFSMAIERGTAGGYIAFGGLPPVNYTGSFASSPIQVYSGSSSSSNQLTFYTITPDALVYTGSAKTNSQQYIVDSGTTLLYFPTSIATKFNSLYSPKPSASTGYISCTAKAPSLGIKIGGTTFTINPADLILKDPDSGKCITTIVDGGTTGPFILGDVFMKNVVAVFDVGAAEMRFAAHTTY